MIALEMAVRQKDALAAQRILAAFPVRKAVAARRKRDTAVYRVWIDDQAEPQLIAALRSAVRSFILCSISRDEDDACAKPDDDACSGAYAFRALNEPGAEDALVMPRMFGFKLLPGKGRIS